MARRFAAPRDRVFEAWTRPDEFRQWWPPDRYTIPEARMDVAVGGRYQITMQQQDGGLQYLTGRYLEVRPRERLVMTWSLAGTQTNDWYEALVSVDLEPIGRGH